MPQFDFYLFSTQTFWNLLCFFSVYFFSLYFYLSYISAVIKMRKKLLKAYIISTKDYELTTNILNLYELFLKKIINK